MFGHPHQKPLLVTRVSLFFALEVIWQILIMVLGLLIPTTNGANGQNVEGVLLQLIHRSHLLKKDESARKSGDDVQERIRTVLVVIRQARKVDTTTIVKTTKGTGIGTVEGTVLRVRRSGSRRRAWNKLPRALLRNLTTTNGSRNPALVASWDPLPSQQRLLLQRQRRLLGLRLLLSLWTTVRIPRSDPSPPP